jgi:hypothetical protein
MKAYKLISTLTIVLSTYTINASAHDPKEHAKENEAAKCEKMQDMGKMDKNDPVMMAMMKKCAKMPKDHQMKAEHGDMPMQDQDDMDKEDEHSDHH